MFLVRANLNFLKDFRPSQSLFLKISPNLATFRPGVLPWLFVPAFRPDVWQDVRAARVSSAAPEKKSFERQF